MTHRGILFIVMALGTGLGSLAAQAPVRVDTGVVLAMRAGEIRIAHGPGRSSWIALPVIVEDD